MGKTILIVDDDPAQRRLLQAAVERNGFLTRADFLERFLPRHAGHDEIEEDNVDVLMRFNGRNRLRAVFRRACRKPVALDRGLQKPALRRIVIDDQDRLRHRTHQIFDALL